MTTVPMLQLATMAALFLGIAVVAQLCSPSEATAHVWAEPFGWTPLHFQTSMQSCLGAPSL